jgi:hypothetical protein
VLLVAVTASAASLLAMAALQTSTPPLLILAAPALSGIFRSVGFSAYNSIAFADIEPEKMTDANTLLATLQELGGGLGVTVGALLLRLGEPVSEALGLPSSPASAYRWRWCCWPC